VDLHVTAIRGAGRGHGFLRNRAGAARLTDLQPPWQRIRKRAGRIHDLRHTFASVAVVNGQGLLMIGKLLGHSQVQTTARYAHLAAEPVKIAADSVANSLCQALG
jgi:site-specific recombinase XerD